MIVKIGFCKQIVNDCLNAANEWPNAMQCDVMQCNNVMLQPANNVNNGVQHGSRAVRGHKGCIKNMLRGKIVSEDIKMHWKHF